MTARLASRLPPAGRRLGARAFAPLRHDGDAPERLRDALRERLGGADVQLFASGRAALRAAFVSAAARNGRREVVLPAYTCFSVAAAAVAAGLRVRLVDVTSEGRIAPASLAALPMDRAAALVACNLFGFAEPMPAGPALEGVLRVDDAAQALGAQAADGAAGTRGDMAILSFGRGKPFSALSGGALLSGSTGAFAPAPPSPAGHPLATVLRALAYDAALSPLLFGWLARIPALGIGETPFEPVFETGGLAADAAALALAVLPGLDDDRRRREDEAGWISARLVASTALVPIGPAPGGSGSYPRLACLAPDPAARDAARDALARVGAGASTLYPCALSDVPGLAPHLEGSVDTPGARDLAARLLTLPTHGGLRGARLDAALSALTRAGCT